MDLAPLSEGHTLVVTKEHFENLYEATPEAIAAVALGGVSLAGGRGGFIGAGAGALVILQLELALTSTQASTFLIQMIFGIVLVLAVLFNAVVARRR